MTRVTVTLHTEQEAYVELDAPEGTSNQDLRELALAEIDAGRADWDTVNAYAEVEWEGDE